MNTTTPQQLEVGTFEDETDCFDADLISDTELDNNAKLLSGKPEVLSRASKRILSRCVDSKPIFTRHEVVYTGKRSILGFKDSNIIRKDFKWRFGIDNTAYVGFKEKD